MANTQTTVPTFVSGQVLEAAQLNNSAGTGVPVFATTVTRDAGFGGAGEKALAEGQLCYLESTNVVQYYDGAAWATLGPAPAASSALTFISGGSFGTGTTFSLPNGSFTSAYTNYLLTYTNVQLSGSNLMMRMRVSGTDVTSSDYSCGLVQSDMSGNVSGVGISSGDNFRIASSSGSQLQSANGFMNIFNPNTSVVTFITFANMGNNSLTNNGAGRLNLSSAQDSLTFYGHNSVNFSNGIYRLYGLADS